MTIRSFSLPLAAAALAALAAGCGSSNSDSGQMGTAASSSPMATTVSAERIAGVGTVLVDSAGRALYSPDQERSGHVMCTGGCTAVWVPVAAHGMPTAGAHVAKVGVVQRPGGRQVTVGGHPAYTFAQDSPGKVTGQGAHDAFGGRKFTWHVLTATGAAAPAASTSGGSDGGGYGGGYVGGGY